MKPSPYQITAFTQAARERSFSKAAIALGVTQSSITQHVAKLEQIMGTQLFVRRRDGLELTRAARELFEVSDRLRTLEQVIGEKIESYSNLSTGHLRIVANAPRPVMPAIAQFLQLYPQVQIEFSLVSWTIAMRQLRNREVDVAVVTEPDSLDGIFLREVGSTRYKAHMRRDLAPSAMIVSLSELRNDVVILPEDGSLTQRVFNAKAGELGLVFPRVIKITTFPAVKEAVLHGVGIGILLEDSLFPSSRLVALEIAEMPKSYRNCVATPIDKRDLRFVKSFIDLITDQADSQGRN